jgi:hypothetical protein
MPSVGVGGQKLRQQCVSGRLKAADALSGNMSPYKAEVNYDMSREPPAPIMDSGIATRVHDYLPGWIQKYWPGGLGGYTPGVGNIRRPDVVVVRNSSLPPTQDNLKSVVEVKFPGDTFSAAQRDAYERIAGSADKVEEMAPDSCGCSEDGGQTQSVPSTSSVPDSFDESLRTTLRIVPLAPPIPPVLAP